MTGNTTKDLIELGTILTKKFFNGDKQKKQDKIAKIIMQEFIEKIDRQNSYNYDYKSIKFNDLSANNMAFIKNFIFKHQLDTKLLKAVKTASRHGYSGILQRVWNNQVRPQNVYIFDRPKFKFDELQCVYLTEDYIDIEKYDKDILSIMKLHIGENGRYILTNMDIQKDDYGKYDFKNEKPQTYINKETNGVFTMEYEYETDVCPLNILENNEEVRGDWEFAYQEIRLSSKFSAIVETEWEYTKIQLLNNLVYNPDKTAREVQNAIEGGNDRVHEVADPDGKLQSALSYLSSGGATADIAVAIKNNYKDEIQQLTFSLGVTSGGNNKHTTEVISDNMDAFKYMYVKKHIFETFIKKMFFNIINLSVSLNDGFATAREDIIDLDISFSPVIELVLKQNDETTNTNNIQQETNDTESEDE